MSKKFNNILKIILPSKRINFFVIFTIILGIISGSIFIVILSKEDQTLVINQIQGFFTSINNNSLNSGLAFKNSLIVNFTFIAILWILGMSMLGIIINIFFTYIKGFVLGFSISAIIYTYGAKGIIGSLIYVFPTSLINLLITIILSVYSIMFTTMLFRQIFLKKNLNSRLFFKKYFIILCITSGLAIISAISEAFILPSLLKLVVKLFV